MTEPLPLASIDVRTLAMLLDHRDYGAGYFDPETGQAYQSFDDEVIGDDGEPVDLDETDWVSLGGDGSRAAYDDMVDFAEAVADPQLSRQLSTAVGGRGAFRRFKDAIYRAPEPISRAWGRFQDARSELRAIRWLLAQEFVREAEGATEAERLRSVCDEALSVAGADTAPTCEEAALPDRWPELAKVVESGERVVIVRDGRPWAVIERL